MQCLDMYSTERQAAEDAMNYTAKKGKVLIARERELAKREELAKKHAKQLDVDGMALVARERELAEREELVKKQEKQIEVDFQKLTKQIEVDCQELEKDRDIVNGSIKALKEVKMLKDSHREDWDPTTYLNSKRICRCYFQFALKE